MDHPCTSKKCIVYTKEKEIKDLEYSHKISYSKAKELHEKTHGPRSFASTLKKVFVDSSVQTDNSNTYQHVPVSNESDEFRSNQSKNHKKQIEDIAQRENTLSTLPIRPITSHETETPGPKPKNCKESNKNDNNTFQRREEASQTSTKSPSQSKIHTTEQYNTKKNPKQKPSLQTSQPETSIPLDESIELQELTPKQKNKKIQIDEKKPAQTPQRAKTVIKGNTEFPNNNDSAPNVTRQKKNNAKSELPNCSETTPRRTKNSSNSSSLKNP